MSIFILFVILLGLAFSYLMGGIASKIIGDKDASGFKYITIGVLGGFLSGIGSEVLNIQDFWLHVPLYGVSLLIVAALLQKQDSGSNQKDASKERRESMSNLDYKSLIRIPVWALYSLIVATVVMSIVMLVNIWFPETIDEELIWKIILSYAVFLISALVIANLTDKVKNMKQFEEEK
jgi:hypothetical protein